MFAFPPPGGPYAVGTLTYHSVDSTRVELFTSDPRSPRGLVAQVWYPAALRAARVTGHASNAPAPYLPDGLVVAALARSRRLPPFVFAQLRHVMTHAIVGAAVAGTDGGGETAGGGAERAAEGGAQGPRWPVVLFLEGLGGFRQMNTAQAEALASRGYVVMALDQPYTAAAVALPGGRVAVMPSIAAMQPLVRASYLPPYLPPGAPAESVAVLAARAHPVGGLPDGLVGYLAADVRAALDLLTALDRADPRSVLTGRLDLGRVGVFGVSLGGIVAAAACRREPRLRACLILDAPMPTDVVHAGLSQPVLWFTRPVADMRRERARAGGWSEDEIRAHQTSMRAVFDRLPGDGYLVEVPGAFHLDFTDIPRWSPLVRALGLAGPIGAERAEAIVTAYTAAFFDCHLRGRAAPLLDTPPHTLVGATRGPTPAAAFTEVRVTRRRALGAKHVPYAGVVTARNQGVDAPDARHAAPTGAPFTPAPP